MTAMFVGRHPAGAEALRDGPCESSANAEAANPPYIYEVVKHATPAMSLSSHASHR